MKQILAALVALTVILGVGAVTSFPVDAVAQMKESDKMELKKDLMKMKDGMMKDMKMMEGMKGDDKMMTMKTNLEMRTKEIDAIIKMHLDKN